MWALLSKKQPRNALRIIFLMLAAMPFPVVRAIPAHDPPLLYLHQNPSFSLQTPAATASLGDENIYGSHNSGRGKDMSGKG